MKIYVIAAPLLLIAAQPAGAMNVQLFLAKAEALKKKGPLALFSSDLKLLMNQVQSDMRALKAEKEAAEATNRPKAFCPPAGTKASMNDEEVLEAMRAVSPAKRASTTSKDALRGYFARRYPCPR